MNKYISVKDIINIGKKEHNMNLKIIAGENGLTNKVRTTLINRPGVTLAGYFKNFAYNRVQIFGKGECAYITDTPPTKMNKVLEKFFSYKIPCCILTFNAKLDKEFCNIADRHNVPVLVSKLSTGELINTLTTLLIEYLAPCKTVHGVLIEVYGMGILILGESGVGKSECALELIARGHRLVADDVVVVKRISSSILSGTGANFVQYYMEIRGLGIIDIKSLFGVGAVRENKRIDMVVFLEEWKPRKEYDRLGIEENYYKILGVKIPLFTIPVKPGRNIPTLIETAAKNVRLKKLKIVAAEELDKKLFKKR